MSLLLNSLYTVALIVLSPWLLYKTLTTGKHRRGLWGKLTGAVTTDHWPLTAGHCVWFHGVSVGEIHLLRPVVAGFRREHPEWRCVISTSTDTGMGEAKKHFPDLPAIWWPFDFTWSVKKALERVQPDLVVLAEGEMWPNFIMRAKAKGIPIAIINGRMSPRSFRRYCRLGWLTRQLLPLIDLFAVQTAEYGRCFRSLGALAEHIHVTGSVKYDGVSVNRQQPKTQELAQLFEVKADELVWIAGSTQASEEQIVLDIYHKLKPEHAKLRLFIVPRQKERFEEVAQLLERNGAAFVRRSKIEDRTASDSLSSTRASPSSIVLVDTIGELSALWGLADVAFVGGSLDGQRGGQNMIEPAAYGAAVIFGPHVWNFRDTVDKLLAADAALQVANAAELEGALRRLLGDPLERQRLGQAAQQLVQAQQGATARTLSLLAGFTKTPPLAIAS